MKLTASRLQIEAAKEAVAKEYGIHPDAIALQRRLEPFVEARAMFCFLLKTSTDCRFTQISRILKRNHTMPHYAVIRILELMKIYPCLRKRYDRIVTDYLALL